MVKDVHTSNLIRGCFSHEIFVSLGEYQRRIRAWMHTGAEEDVQRYKYLNRIVLSPQTDYEERRRREDIFSFSYAWKHEKGAKRPAKKRKIDIKFPA
jgi:hypothetical protein